MSKGKMKFKGFTDLSVVNFNNLKNVNGERMIHVATLMKDLKMLQMILDQNVDVNAVTKKKHTALHYTALKGFEEGASLLIERQSNINAQDSDGNTPLHLNVARGHINVVKLLLKHGANKSIKNNSGETPLLLSTSEEMSYVLKQEGALED